MKKHDKKRGPIQAALGIIAVVVLLVVIGWVVLPGKSIDVLQPAGEVAGKQLNLMIFTVGLTMTVIVPVFILLFFMAWKYRDDNPKKVKYSPEDEGSNVLEAIWWGVPLIIITVLGVVTWFTTHDLDPYKPIASDQPAVEVQVISLNWKWLFIYPEQGVASVNELYIPVDRPVHFTLTGDSPMSSMWIPKLGSQVYVMKGMSTQLNAKGTEVGVLRGSNSSISGEGYADMDFKVHVVDNGEWTGWIDDAKTGSKLNMETYEKLALPSRHNPTGQFALDTPDLYNQVVMKYMGHGGLGIIQTPNEDQTIDHNMHGVSH